jgi:maltooligosyltrehalose trehalohydrolase
MGEEWAASTRWPFFTSHPEPALSAATGPGRIEEFAGHGWDVSQMVDPQDAAAFREAKLDWSELADAGHASMHVLYRTLLRLRRDESDLSDPRLDSVRVDFDEAANWLVVHRRSLRVVANLAQAPQYVPVGAREIVLMTGSERALLGVEATLMPARSAAILRT